MPAPRQSKITAQREAYTLSHWVSAVASISIVCSAAAQYGFDVLDDRPVAVIGDIVAVPIQRNGETGRYANIETFVVQTDEGVELEALVAYSLRAPYSVNDGATWSAPARRARFVAQTPNSGAPGLLLIDVPTGFAGTISARKLRLLPRWIEAAPDQHGQPLAVEQSAAWPSLADPGEYWRWMLLADTLKATPPGPLGSLREQLLAKQLGGLWRAGLARLEAISPGTASELRELLVARCRGEDGPQLAAWITDRTELRSLLDLLLKATHNDKLIAQSILSYLDARFPILIWTESSTSTRAVVALANPTDGEMVARLQWMNRDTIPVAAIIPAGRVVRVQLLRPQRATSVVPAVVADEPHPQELQVSVGARRHYLKLPAERVIARPPGASFGTIVLPLTLEETWSGVMRIAPETWDTIALLRKRSGAWEIFLECRFDPQSPPTDDSVTVVIGPSDAPIRRFIVSRDAGLVVEPIGARRPGAQASVRKFKDRWRAVLTLNAAFLERAGVGLERDTLLAGLWRTLDGKLFSIASAALPPWCSEPPMRLFDLSGWGEIDPAPSDSTSALDRSLYSTP